MGRHGRYRRREHLLGIGVYGGALPCHRYRRKPATVAKILEKAELFKTIGHSKAMNFHTLIEELSAFMRDKTRRQKKMELGTTTDRRKWIKNGLFAS